MNREEVNWLLQTIKDAKNAKRFVLAQHESRRISFQLMTDVAQERGWINRRANGFLTTAARHSTELPEQPHARALLRELPQERNARVGWASLATPRGIRGY